MKIIVKTEKEKHQLLEASEHLHGADVDLDLPMVNTLAHLYLNPDLIVVDENGLSSSSSAG